MLSPPPHTHTLKGLVLSAPSIPTSPKPGKRSDPAAVCVRAKHRCFLTHTSYFPPSLFLVLSQKWLNAFPAASQTRNVRFLGKLFYHVPLHREVWGHGQPQNSSPEAGRDSCSMTHQQKGCLPAVWVRTLMLCLSLQTNRLTEQNLHSFSLIMKTNHLNYHSTCYWLWKISFYHSVSLLISRICLNCVISMTPVGWYALFCLFSRHSYKFGDSWNKWKALLLSLCLETSLRCPFLWHFFFCTSCCTDLDYMCLE